MAQILPDKYKLLKKYWGYDLFRPMQEEVVDSVLGGRDTLALMPTGGGKSVCYQLPAIAMEGTCLVVSPLIALMKDQVQQLNNRHLKAACITSGLNPSETSNVLNNAVTGQLKFLYVSPERLRNTRFIEHFRHMKICLIAVDEAHCVSQWGYDFRPTYLQIADIRQYHPTAPLVALTATATPAVAQDITFRLAMRNALICRSSFARDNLTYTVYHESNRGARLLHLLRQTDGSAIVYVRSRRETKVVADMLEAEGISAQFYHAGLSTTERDNKQQLWTAGKCRVMVATNAFGMGIDKADVRLVVHWGAPNSVEAYFQEAGRAGRDGQPALAAMIYTSTDEARLQKGFNSAFPPVKFIRNVYRALCNYYKIPVGSGADSRFDFSVEKICDTYNMPIVEFYSACQFLEREGLISLPEREETSSTIFVPTGRDELYRFQVNHLRLGNLLQILLRMYPGISMTAVAIEERRIASRLATDTSDIRDMLGQLHAMHVLEYTPRTKKPQIIFTSERIPEQNIALADDHYANLREAAWRRLQTMLAYISCNTTCRSRQLLAYFGETSGTHDCGRCDVCKSHSASPIDYRHAILDALHGQTLPLHDILPLAEERDRNRLQSTIREMLDSGELHMDADMCISAS